MRYARLDKNNKVVNILIVDNKHAVRLKKEINIISITEIEGITHGCIWNPKTKQFTIPEEVAEKEEEKTIYDEIQKLKEKIALLEAKQ